MSTPLDEIRRQIAESCRVQQSYSPELLAGIADFAARAAAAIRAGGKLVYFGNGGSAADAQHLAAELTVRLQTTRPGIAALALTTNSSVLTAAGNDFGFEQIYSRQVESLVSKSDVVVAISTSGNSANVVRGAQAARSQGALVVAMTGQTGGALAAHADILINVPSQNAQRIQEAHITIGHAVCAVVEQAVAKQ